MITIVTACSIMLWCGGMTRAVLNNRAHTTSKKKNPKCVCIQLPVPFLQAFYVSEVDLDNIMEQYPVVEERLWRVCGIRIATQLLTQLPEYQVNQPANVWSCVTPIESAQWSRKPVIDASR